MSTAVINNGKDCRDDDTPHITVRPNAITETHTLSTKFKPYSNCSN